MRNNVWVRIGGVLGVLAAIAGIISLLYTAHVFNPPPPDPTATPFPTATSTPIIFPTLVPTPTPFVPTAADFVGQWDGFESPSAVDKAPTLIRIVVTQQGDLLQADFYLQTGGQLPSTPSDSATSTLSGGQVTFFVTVYYSGGDQVFSDEQWVLSLPNPGQLHFTHHTHYEPAFAAGRPDTDTDGDLHHS
jgi:hypothetical protein